MITTLQFPTKAQRAAVMLALVFWGIVTFDLLIATVRFRSWSFDTIGSLAFGIIFSQMAMAAVWLTLAPLPLYRRFLQATAFVVLVYLCHVAFYWHHGMGWIGAPICLVGLTIWFAVQLPLWILRRRLGLVLTIPGRDSPDLCPGDRIQFGIRGLLIVTALVAIVLAVARYFASRFPNSPGSFPASSPDFWWQLTWFLLAMTTFQALAAVPVILSVLIPREFAHWLILAGLWSLVVHFAAVAFFDWMSGTGRQRVEPFVWMNGVQFTTITVVLLLARRAGLRGVPMKSIEVCQEGA